MQKGEEGGRKKTKKKLHADNVSQVRREFDLFPVRR